MRLAISALILAMIAPPAAAQVSCADLLKLHHEALQMAQTAQMTGVGLLAMPYTLDMDDTVATAITDAGNDLSGSWKPYVEHFNDLAARHGCLTPAE